MADPIATASIAIDPDTSKLSQTLRVIAKHATACAHELDVLAGRTSAAQSDSQPEPVSSWGR